MTRDLATIDPDATVVEAARRMTGRRVGAILVLEGVELQGILTERDVLQAVARASTSRLASRLMTRNPETIAPSETTAQAATPMLRGGFRRLPVVEKGLPVGIVPSGT